MTDTIKKDYELMLQDDQIWADKLVSAVQNDTRSFIKYKKDTRAITSIKNMMETSAELFAGNVAFYTKFRKGPYEAITYKQFLYDINSLGTAMIMRGFKNKRIAVIGETRYMWCVADMAAVCGVGVVVPLDKELPYDQLKNLINQAGVSAVFFDRKREAIFTKMMAEGETGLTMLVGMDEDEDKTAQENEKSIEILSQRGLIKEGSALLESGDRSFVDARIDSREMAIILFTSGTTGISKGIMLSHRNICADLMVSPTLLEIKSNDIFFSVLPIHHTYEYTCGFLVPMFRGAAIAHCEGLKYITRNMQEIHPTVMLAVPAIFEALNKQIWKGIKSKGKEQAANKGLKICKFVSKFGIDLSGKFFKEVKENLGGAMRLFICGGAAINPEILDEFRLFGINALQGYGLTECAPMGALNPDTAPHSDSCGVAFPGCGAKIIDADEDGVGEICLKGENIMLGYYERPDLTAEVIDEDHWFHTGDLGYIDGDGYIVITGRKKNVIITKNGKNVFPEELEYHLSLSEAIAESMVFEQDASLKDDTNIAASIYPNWEYIRVRLGADAENNETVEKFLWEEVVDKLNAENPGYKMIRTIYLRHEPLVKNTSNKVIRFKQENKEAN